MKNIWKKCVDAIKKFDEEISNHPDMFSLCCDYGNLIEVTDHNFHNVLKAKNLSIIT